MEHENQFGRPAVKALMPCFLWFVASLAEGQDKPPINRVKEMLRTGKVTFRIRLALDRHGAWGYLH
jgi:hypothetical protein